MTTTKLGFWGSDCMDCGNATHASMRCDSCGHDDTTVALWYRPEDVAEAGSVKSPEGVGQAEPPTPTDAQSCIRITDADGNPYRISEGHDCRPFGIHHRDTGHKMALLTAYDASCAECEWRAERAIVVTTSPIDSVDFDAIRAGYLDGKWPDPT